MKRERILKYFKISEISSEELFYRFTKKKKIITFVPEEYVDKLMTKMSKSGAGRIGNYEMCSFRMSGTGTYKPGKNTKPYKGKINKISYTDEIRFEIECEAGKLNRVVDVLLEHHPYDEVAYEIYDFIKREKESSGIILNLKKIIDYQDLLKRLNPEINITLTDEKATLNIFNRIAFSDSLDDKNLISTAGILNCGCLVILCKNNIKIYNIN